MNREIRRFGTIWMLMSAAAATAFYYRHHPLAARALWTASVTVGLLSWIAPSWAGYFYRAWTALGEGIGFVVSRVAMTLMFVGVVTPLGIVLRCLRRDALRLKKSSFRGQSYWQEHEKIPDASYYRHLF